MRYSQLKPRTVRAAILVLVQHNILWHATSEDEGEVFEVNIDECLTRLRFGRYVWLAEQRFGMPVCTIAACGQYPNAKGTLLQGAEIVQLLLDHGKLRPPDIMSRLAPQGSKGTRAGSCPVAVSLILLSRFHRVFASFAQARHVVLSQAVDRAVARLPEGQAYYV